MLADDFSSVCEYAVHSKLVTAVYHIIRPDHMCPGRRVLDPSYFQPQKQLLLDSNHANHYCLECSCLFYLCFLPAAFTCLPKQKYMCTLLWQCTRILLLMLSSNRVITFRMKIVK